MMSERGMATALLRTRHHRSSLPIIIYTTKVIRRAHSTIKVKTHPQHHLFTLLPSGRPCRSLESRAKHHLWDNFHPEHEPQPCPSPTPSPPLTATVLLSSPSAIAFIRTDLFTNTQRYNSGFEHQAFISLPVLSAAPLFLFY